MYMLICYMLMVYIYVCTHDVHMFIVCTYAHDVCTCMYDIQCMFIVCMCMYVIQCMFIVCMYACLSFVSATVVCPYFLIVYGMPIYGSAYFHYTSQCTQAVASHD